MPKVHKPAGTPCFDTREECESWMRDRVVRWNYQFHPKTGALEKNGFKVLNTKNPDYQSKGEDEPITRVARPARDIDTRKWFAFMQVLTG